MKKTRLLASFLSLGLGLTSFSAAPVTISAETVETSVMQTTTSAETVETAVTQTTTSAETEGLAPVIHDIDTAREKFEKYIEETDIDANIAEEGKYPQYDGKIVIECEPDTDAYARIFKFADENMILHELFETVIKFDTSKTVNYTVSFRFVDEQTGENIENIHAKLYRYNNKLEPNEDEPGSYFITRDRDVEPVLIAEWNSTETPVFTSETITSYLAQYGYLVITDKLPEGYNFYGKDHAETGCSGAIGNGDHSMDIRISKGDPTPETVDIPLEGTFSLDVRVVDQNRNIPLKGMKCEVFEKYSGEVVAEWNTSDTEVMHIEGLEYKFEGNKILEDFGKKIYQFRITNLPENYIYYGYQEDSLTLCGVYIDEFAEGNELSATAYLIDQSPDAPEIKYTTSAVSQVSTTTTTSVTSTVKDTTKGKGDANCDGNVDMSDAVLIMQSIANPSKYKLTEEGKANADMNGDGITSGDALAIQKKLLHLDDIAVTKCETMMDWYSLGQSLSGFYNKGYKPAVITNPDELKEYIEQAIPEEIISSYLEKYNDSFFKDNVLLIYALQQTMGMNPAYAFVDTEVLDDQIKIYYKSAIQWGHPHPMFESICFAQVIVPKTAYNGQTVNWEFVES